MSSTLCAHIYEPLVRIQKKGIIPDKHQLTQHIRLQTTMVYEVSSERRRSLQPVESEHE